MNDCRLSCLADTLEGLVNLKILCLNNNSIGEVSEADLKDTKQLEHIQMNYNCLLDIPEVFLQLRCMRSIELAGNYLKAKDENVKKFKTELTKRRVKLSMLHQR